MPPDENILKAFDEAIQSENDTFAWLESLKELPEAAHMSIQPILPLLITAAEFLAENQETLKQTYIDVAS